MVAAAYAALLLGCGGGDTGGATPTTPPPAPSTPVAPAGPLTAGVTVQDAAGFVEYTPGTAPLVVVAPHGGALLPAGVPDRTCTGCTTANDLNTQDMARAIVAAFAARTGATPHLVVNRLHRRKFDGNRDRDEATGGNRALDTTWLWYHAAIDSARARVTSEHRRGLLIDLHGHAHDIARLELGYLLDGAELRLSDSALTAGGFMTRTSVARLAQDAVVAADRGMTLLRGANSLGSMLASRGYAAVPSAADPAPLAGQPYFNGGYNTVRHGSLTGGAVDAIQIETPGPGARDTEAARAQFAATLADVLVVYLNRHYGWTAPR